MAASAARAQTIDQWVPEAGDIMICDITENMCYLLHATTDEYLPFRVGSGAKGTARHPVYGYRYNTQTPIMTWTAAKKDLQPFGKTRRFYRLYVNGKRTHYGIHSYKNIDKWLAEDDRYASLGCIVVSEEMLDIINLTFERSDYSFTVITTEGKGRLLYELSMREQWVSRAN